MAEHPSAETGMSPTEIDTMRSVEDQLWWYRGLRGHVLHLLRRQRAGFEILDAGCGSGGMLARVQERFPAARLSGLDYSARALELTAARGVKAQLVQGRADELPFPSASFDVVLSLDVLVIRGIDDRAALREMERVLRPGGMLLLNLAAFEFLRGSHDAATNMARRYRRPQVAALLREAGFTLQHGSYWNMILLPAIAAVRRLSRRRVETAAVRSDLKPSWPPVNLALTALTKIELALARHISLPFGTSLFLIARK